MIKPILVDTDVFVDYLCGNSQAEKLIEANSEHIVLSSIVVAELYSGVKGGYELSILSRLILLFPVIPVSTEIARVGGLFRNEYRKSHGTGLTDAIIAATATLENASLKTLNVKHFPMIKGLKPAYKKSQVSGR